jgi:hypothetical protein
MHGGAFGMESASNKYLKNNQFNPFDGENYAHWQYAGFSPLF